MQMTGSMEEGVWLFLNRCREDIGLSSGMSLQHISLGEIVVLRWSIIPRPLTQDTADITQISCEMWPSAVTRSSENGNRVIRSERRGCLQGRRNRPPDRVKRSSFVREQLPKLQGYIDAE